MANGLPRTIYGRRRGKPLRVGRREVLERLLPQVQIVPADYKDGALDPRGLFKPEIYAVWLEVGFGAGEHLAAMAQAHPEIGFIGCEPFINGVARLLSLIDQQGLDNIRIVADDAGLLLDCLTADSIGRAFLLFPDPWPKRRHNKRRFVEAKNIAGMARILANGADWRIATDHMDYCRWILMHMSVASQFEWSARRPGDWRRRPDDWPATRYEGKGIEAGRPPVFLSFKRRDR